METDTQHRNGHIEQPTTTPFSRINTSGQIRRNTNGQIPGHISGQIHTDTSGQIPEELIDCDFCKFLFQPASLRVCYDCDLTFCLGCAPRLGVAVLQCCNYHGLVLWFCSDLCRRGHSAEQVRVSNQITEPCAN